MPTKWTDHKFDEKRLDGRKDDLTEYFGTFAEWADRVQKSRGVNLLDPSASKKNKRSDSSGVYNEYDKDRVIPEFFGAGKHRPESVVWVTFSQPGPLGLQWGQTWPAIESIDPGSLATEQGALRPGMVLVEIQGQNMRGKSLDEAGVALRSAGRPVRLAFVEVELPESELQREEAEPFHEPESEPALDVGRAQTEASVGGGEPASDGAEGFTAVEASSRPDVAQGTVARDSEAPDGSDSGIVVREQAGRSLVPESAEELRQQRQALMQERFASLGQSFAQPGSESDSEASGSRR